MATSSTTSSRFRRAAETERGRLDRQRAKLAVRAGELREELDALEGKLRELNEQIDSLGELIGDRESRRPEEPSPAPAGDARVLAGSAIRTTAVRLLVESDGAKAPIHYRQWFDLLRHAGYEVAGKRPDAVFLSQISRSPAVRATTKPGVYELDLEAPERLSRDLRRFQQELGDLAAQPPLGRTELMERAARQQEIGLEIRRTQKALAETAESLGGALPNPAVRLVA